MSNQPPLNPDALEAAERWMQEKSATFGLHWKNAKPIIEAYLAAAQPEVRTVEELDALPYGSLITGTSGVTVMKYDGPNYDWITGNDYRYRMEEQEQCLPARVLYRPAVNDA